MAVNLGTYLGLIGAGVCVWAGSRYIKQRVKKEVKNYGEENIKSQEEIRATGFRESGELGRRGRTSDGSIPEVEGTEPDAIYGEQQDEVEGIDEGRGRIPTEFAEHPREHQREPSESNEADKPGSDSIELYSEIPDVEPI